MVHKTPSPGANKEYDNREHQYTPLNDTAVKKSVHHEPLVPGLVGREPFEDFAGFMEENKANNTSTQSCPIFSCISSPLINLNNRESSVCNSAWTCFKWELEELVAGFDSVEIH